MKKTAIYGLPINPMSLMDQLKGQSFCVSYATRDKLGRQLDQAIELVGQDGILMIDNGAFSYHKQGIDTRSDDYIEGFFDWANDILRRSPQAWFIYPDIIGGTAEENWQLIQDSMMLTPDAQRGMPVWHLHEPLDYLVHMAEGFSFICFGSSGDYWQVGTPKWHARVKEAFAAIDQFILDGEGAYVRPRIHMLRAQSMAHLYEFDSSDSTNVAMNHGRYRREGHGHVERFAERASKKINASSKAESDHQLKRPLLDHLRQSAWELNHLLFAAGYQVTFT